jgi:Second Messenger Oligonucleotide or Dinucleotide Synthetase domain
VGGSGGSTSYGMEDVDTSALRDRLRRDLQQQELVADINAYLADQLAAFNDRDTEAVKDRLEQIADALGDAVEGLDRLLFGGSIAKHTYVDGLSDVDALVVLRGDQPDNPARLIAAFANALRAALPTSAVADVEPGRLAVTITYADGTQIQLLPARRRGETLSIASEDGRSWRDVRPRKFAEKLTQVNQANGGGVVPAIKLAKATLDQLPEPQRLSGYHVEAIAIDAFKNYGGPSSHQALLRHLLGHAAGVVLRPTGDITGQSVHIDTDLGSANSVDRQRISAAIRRIVSKMDGATSVDDYKDLFGD